MKLAQTWPEIEANILASRRAKISGYSEEALGFIGGGRDTIVKIERLLEKKLPNEFSYYVAALAPREDYNFEAIPTPFGPYLELYSFTKLSLDVYPEWRKGERTRMAEPFLVGDDGACAVVLDLGHPYCPAYLSGELGTDLLAHSFANFLLILSCHDLVYTTVDAETDYKNRGYSKPDPRWDEAANRIKAKISEIAPDCMEAWT